MLITLLFLLKSFHLYQIYRYLLKLGIVVFTFRKCKWHVPSSVEKLLEYSFSKINFSWMLLQPIEIIYRIFPFFWYVCSPVFPLDITTCQLTKQCFCFEKKCTQTYNMVWVEAPIEQTLIPILLLYEAFYFLVAPAWVRPLKISVSCTKWSSSNRERAKNTSSPWILSCTHSTEY